MQDKIIMAIPRQALEEITRATWKSSLDDFLAKRMATEINVLTFGMVNTPIQRDGATVGYVVFWDDGTVTACGLLENKILSLLGVDELENAPSPKQALEIWLRVTEREHA